MKGLKLDPHKIAEELTEFNANLFKSFQTIQQIRDIDVGANPKECIYQEDKLTLFRYSSPIKKKVKTPLLIVYALVNRYYMVDLQHDRSLINGLLSAGIDVYLIDWGYPDPADRYLDLDDYVNGYIDNCVDEVLKDSKQPKLNILGICQGGTLSLCYTALHGEKVKNLITMVTPVDFHTEDNLLSHLAREVDTDLAVDTYGNIPGVVLNDAYNSLMPMRLGIQKNLGMPANLESHDKALNFLRMEKWIYDSPDQAGEAFRQFIKQFFQQNLLIKGEAKIGDDIVDLAKISQPILNMYATHDHLVPPSASVALKDYVSTEDYNEFAFKAGHIGIFVSGRAQKDVPEAIYDWLLSRDK
ncbi:class III poly(R)-hydroxyalkanoic acid synthase subunit PhaC [Pokkaliibacter sp. MBI-7]|uniref:class III poly(R)-hydroxyalkanoic acid synthase subunit PhaC n=1 Tax=Pokkaliibacter sp. MBI-7 TaxID=3040600 RepID=UPI00244CD753|nr:class III poly(R)-hydroxyalkanoic acid synthase subunit PhaC [Pokkaliibacter sp. MBI-7]MDH2435083.1 class III poly(R)-hydroxyalkanoic acid synthase subunit PhaC [Pokkaliibacter sp. MBI-7]